MSPLIAVLSAVLAGVPVHQDPASAPRPTSRPAPARNAGADPLVAEAKLLTQQAAGGLDGDALCAHLTRTEQLASQLSARMQQAAAKAAPNGDSEPSEAALKKIKRDGQRAQAPGLVIEAISAEGLDVGATVNLATYADQAHAAPGASAFLKAFSVFAGHGRSEDVSLRFVTDMQACTTFQTIVSGLSELAAPWAAAPACLRAQALPRLQAALGKFSANRSCLCEDAATAQKLAAQAAAQLASFPGLDAATVGKQLTDAASPAGARYSCNPAN